MEKTFITNLVFRIEILSSHSKPQFDEQWRIIVANSLHEARKKAMDVGLKEEETFQSKEGNKIRWRFLNIAELYPVEHNVNGSLIFSRTEEPDHPVFYETQLRSKAEVISNTLK